jgi:hypothetical protein
VSGTFLDHLRLVEESLLKLLAGLAGLRATLRLHHRSRMRFGSGLLACAKRIQQIEALMVPAQLLLHLGKHVAHGRPEAQMAIAHKERGRLKPPIRGSFLLGS